MGGRIWAVNNPNGGSTFSFTVKLKAAAAAIKGTLADPSQQGGDVEVEQLPVRAMRILLAEDFVESQDIIRLYLRGTPHQLDCAASGLDAVTTFEKNTYDIVFMDLHMPDMDGYTATCILRNWEREQGRTPVPIIALTANGLTEARIESQAAGCDEFLTKPIKMDTLLGVIRRYAIHREDKDAVEHKSPALPAEPRPRDVKELRRRFITNRLRELPRLHAATMEKQFDEVKIMGHRIKGLAGSYGLDGIGAIGMAMEEAALRLDQSAVLAQLAELTDALRHAEAAGVDDTGADSRAA
jgi:CheY-like chemotaxis protein